MKRYLDKNVYEAAVERYDYIYTHFERVCIYSATARTAALLNLAIEAARRHGNCPGNVLYIDMEAQYARAIEFTHRMFSREEVTGWWVCLPIHLRNACQSGEALTGCVGSLRWAREGYPENSRIVVTDESYFPILPSTAWSLRSSCRVRAVVQSGRRPPPA